MPTTGAVGEELIPTEAAERLAYAQRVIAQRCLYGVDKNPLAAEMAKLSLWLLTLAKDKPFTFLDHAIRCGDSLVGIRDIRQVQYFQLDLDQADRSLFAGPVMSLVDEAVALRRKIEVMPGNTVEDVQDKEQLLKEAEEKTARLRYAADLLISVDFQPAPEGKAVLHNSMAIKAGEYVGNHPLEALKAAAVQALNGQWTFHWPLEFPEVVIDRAGFDAFVCNPPFMGGQKITGNLGEPYREYLVSQLARSQRGSADLCAYFFLRAAGLLRDGGQLGFLATNTIAQGDTREVGLDQLSAAGCVIPRAVPSRPWPGEASLEVAHVWIRRGSWSTPFVLDDNPASGITSFLTEPGVVMGKPFPSRPMRESPSRAQSFLAWASCCPPMKPSSSLRTIRETRTSCSLISTAMTSTPGRTSHRADGSSTSSIGRSTVTRPRPTTLGPWRRIIPSAWRS